MAPAGWSPDHGTLALTTYTSRAYVLPGSTITPAKPPWSIGSIGSIHDRLRTAHHQGFQRQPPVAKPVRLSSPAVRLRPSSDSA